MIDLAGPLAGVVGGLIGLLIGLLMVAFIATRNDKNIVAGEINPRPRFRPPASRRLKSDRAPRPFYVKRMRCDRFRGASMRSPTVRRRERRYHEALNTIFVADAGELSPTVEQLRDLPLDLAYSGAARIIMTLAYFRGTAFSPEGIQTALTFTSRAVQANPQSTDAWVMRLWVAAAAPPVPTS